MPPPSRLLALPVVLALGVTSCGNDDAASPAAIPGVQARMDFGASGDGAFYASPFPSDHRVGSDGRVDLVGFPNPDGVDFVSVVLGLLADEADGFGISAGALFGLTGPVAAERLPARPADALDPDAPVFLVDVDPASPERGRRYPLHARYAADPGPLADPHLLTLLPVQGLPLRPDTTYAAGVLRSLGDDRGELLGVPSAMATLAAGRPLDDLRPETNDSYLSAIETLRELRIEPSDLAGLTVFTTGDPERGMRALADHARSLPVPAVGAWTTSDVFDDYCALETRIEMPIFQEGTPPYFLGGGQIPFDDAGVPIRQGTETSRVVVTVPRRAAPPGGFPAALFIRTGGGGDRPMVDRGTRPGFNLPALEPGEGPARYFTGAGLLGISFDGPHGGLRNVSGIDEQLLVFNFFNPVALRDNIRATAMESILVGRLAASLELDPALCPGSSPAPGATTLTVDGDRMALMGHSMGATIAPLAFTHETAFRAIALSGAGGSYIENIVFKESPVPVKPIASLILRYPGYGVELVREDPFLQLLQWVAEPADPPAYARTFRSPDRPHPQHVLMFQGIVDTYILPPIANANTGSFGFDLAGPAHEDTILDMLALSGGGQVTLPASPNLAGPGGLPATGVVVQHPEDGIEDGHEIVFQRDEPKRQYGCFLETFAGGTPVVPVGESTGPCPR